MKRSDAINIIRDILDHYQTDTELKAKLILRTLEDEGMLPLRVRLKGLTIEDNCWEAED